MVDSYQMVLGAVAVTVMVLRPHPLRALLRLPRRPLGRSISRWRERAGRARAPPAVKALRDQQGLPLEQVVADLRRLRKVVGEDAGRSAAHQMGNRLAYDRLLAQTCDMLEVAPRPGHRVRRHGARDRAAPRRGRARAGRRAASPTAASARPPDQAWQPLQAIAAQQSHGIQGRGPPARRSRWWERNVASAMIGGMRDCPAATRRSVSRPPKRPSPSAGMSEWCTAYATVRNRRVRFSSTRREAPHVSPREGHPEPP